MPAHPARDIPDNPSAAANTAPTGTYSTVPIAIVMPVTKIGEYAIEHRVRRDGVHRPN